jgi:hypothetical protein
MNLLFKMTTCAIALVLCACGYHFQGRDNPLKELGVEKIYVAQFRNTTFRPGIEQLFSTAMIREIQKSRSFQLVNSEDQADAVLTGEVSGAEATLSSSKSVEISPGKNVDVATEYNAGVNCLISLKDRQGRLIFSQSVNGNKIFPGATDIPRYDLPGSRDAGATNSLVNDSEQRLAIQFLATEMMASVYQRMIDTF